MYIESSYNYIFPKRSVIISRERYKENCRDLHKRYLMNLDEKTFLEGSQYKFNELAYPIFDELDKKDFLKKIDLLAISYWAHEFDPDYTSFGLHLLDRYKLNCKMFDVIDQGSVCTLTALIIIKNYMTNCKSEYALCLSLDQTTIPRGCQKSLPIPTKNISSALLISMYRSTKDAISIREVALWTEQRLLEVKFDIFTLIQELLDGHNIQSKDCTLVCKRNITGFRAFNYYQGKHENRAYLDIDFMSLEFGCTDGFQLINQIYHNPLYFKKRYILFLDEDVESLIHGLMIIEMPKEESDLCIHQ